MPYVTDRFGSAVLTLVGDGPVKQRLAEAYIEHLEGIVETELPVGLREAFTALALALHRLPAVGEEHPVRANVRKMAPAAAAEHAAAIVRLYVDLAVQVERVEPLKIVSTAKTPRFLTRP